MKFLVVGNGLPATSVCKVLAATKNAQILALLTSDRTTRAKDVGRVLPEPMIQNVETLIVEGLIEADWIILANSKYIVPKAVLSSLKGQVINFHPGLLPQYAGLNVHQWAIRNGESEFGVTIHRVEPTVDTGAIVAQSRFPVDQNETGLSLYHKCMRHGASLLEEVVRKIVAGEPIGDEPQDLRARRLYRQADAIGDLVNWDQPAEGVRNFIRAGNYHPFESPTYTARLIVQLEQPIDLLEAKVCDGRDLDPGAVIELSRDGPIVACQSGSALVITRAIQRGQLLNADSWHDFLSRTGIKSFA